jgi:hypothetical protein
VSLSTAISSRPAWPARRPLPPPVPLLLPSSVGIVVADDDMMVLVDTRMMMKRWRPVSWIDCA